MPADINARYGLNPAHSEVVAASDIIAPCKALEMGSGSGRNALFLSQLGFSVEAVDANPGAVQSLQGIVQKEGITNLQVRHYDINQAALDTDYGFIACAVTLMFLDPSRVPAVIQNMQEHTSPKGYNVIVCAMNTANTPCPVNFPFTFDEGELKAAYSGWELIKYNEDIGTMHSGAKMQFATLLARKPE